MMLFWNRVDENGIKVAVNCGNSARMNEKSRKKQHTHNSYKGSAH